MSLTKSVGSNIEILKKENKNRKQKRSAKQILAIALSAAGKSNK